MALASTDEPAPGLRSRCIWTTASTEHHGIDIRRTVGAALNSSPGDLQGGSTITEQLTRNLYPEEIGCASSITRKVKEAIAAPKIEAVYSKREILETYLNTIPFFRYSTQQA